MLEVKPTRTDMGNLHASEAVAVKLRSKQTYIRASNQMLPGEPVRSIRV
jgi:hypothetical protein